MAGARVDRPHIPDGLVREIEEGRCVAFVGAGFAAPAVPGWKDLLTALLAKEPTPDEAQTAWVKALLEADWPASRDLEAAAQVLQDHHGEAFHTRLTEVVTAGYRPRKIEQRRRWLEGIPFDAILTTNFDPSLEGDLPGAKGYASILRSDAKPWMDRVQRQDPTRLVPTPTMQLHGRTSSPTGPTGVVFTTQDYRRLVHTTPGYLTFLRSVFATRTVLFLGVSFTDAYLNELRSEVLSVLGSRAQRPIAYAVLEDVSEVQARHLREHDGIEVLPYEVLPESTDGNRWIGFDRYLEELHRRTSPQAILGRAIKDRRILWVDLNPTNNEEGLPMLREAATVAGGRTTIEEVRTPSAALSYLDARAEGDGGSLGDQVDVIITHWGQTDGSDGGPAGAELLRLLRRREQAPPVVVFSLNVAGRREEALRRGATEYTWTWPGLFAELVRVLQDRRE